MSGREKPILFSGPMVLAILDGRKTQTRRIVKLKNGVPTSGAFWAHGAYEPRCWKGDEWRFGPKDSPYFAVGSEHE